MSTKGKWCWFIGIVLLSTMITVANEFPWWTWFLFTGAGMLGARETFWGWPDESYADEADSPDEEGG